MVWQGDKPTRRISTKAKANAPLNAPVEILGAEEDENTRLAEDLSKIRVVESREVSLRETLCHSSGECGVLDIVLSVSSEESIPQRNGMHHVSKITVTLYLLSLCTMVWTLKNGWFILNFSFSFFWKKKLTYNLMLSLLQELYLQCLW